MVVAPGAVLLLGREEPDLRPWLAEVPIAPLEDDVDGDMPPAELFIDPFIAPPVDAPGMAPGLMEEPPGVVAPPMPEPAPPIGEDAPAAPLAPVVAPPADAPAPAPADAPA